MAITSSAKKAVRASLRRKVFNDRRRRAMREAVKRVKQGATDAKALAAAYQAIDKAAKRGVIPKNAAARKKSQMAKLAAK